MRCNRSSVALVIAAIAVLALAPPAHAGTIQLGDSLIPTGLVDGDTFRLVFLTSTTTDATSTDIADYNTFVNTAANLTGSLVKDKKVGLGTPSVRPRPWMRIQTPRPILA